MQRHKLELENIKCNGCANSIKTKLINQFGAEKVEVDNEAGTLSFDYDADIKMIEQSLAKMGYPKKGEGNALNKASSYVSCMIGRVKKDVEEAAVNQ
ncbi:MAG: heavy-metal-associated domain-containing protein [Saprospiraceae bacterium]|nr:heavy-metal-associated domain-containing protein [Saprospiraceae bacterium]